MSFNYDSWLAQGVEDHFKKPQGGDEVEDFEIGDHVYTVQFHWEKSVDCDVDEDIDEEGHRVYRGRDYEVTEIDLYKIWVDGVLDDNDATDNLRDQFVEMAKEWVKGMR